MAHLHRNRRRFRATQAQVKTAYLDFNRIAERRDANRSHITTGRNPHRQQFVSKRRRIFRQMRDERLPVERQTIQRRYRHCTIPDASRATFIITLRQKLFCDDISTGLRHEQRKTNPEAIKSAASGDSLYGLFIETTLY
jgi:hypothetical protein